MSATSSHAPKYAVGSTRRTPGTPEAMREMSGVSAGSLSALSARMTISRSYVQPYISAAARQTRSAEVSMYSLICVVIPRVSQHISASAGTTLRPSCGDAPECALRPKNRTLNFVEARMPVHPAAITPDSSRFSPTWPPKK